MQAENVITNYICTECGETDRDRGEYGQPAPRALHCWHCKAGRAAGQLERGIGMFPEQVIAARNAQLQS